MNQPQDVAPPAAGSRASILAAAAELFAERGFNQVTIRDIAARVDLSPAMVMKCWGSKRELFYEVATIVPPPFPDVPPAQLGDALVRELLQRFAAGALEPLNRALVLRLSAPDPESVRQRFIDGYLDPAGRAARWHPWCTASCRAGPGRAHRARGDAPGLRSTGLGRQPGGGGASVPAGGAGIPGPVSRCRSPRRPVAGEAVSMPQRSMVRAMP